MHTAALLAFRMVSFGWCRQVSMLILFQKGNLDSAKPRRLPLSPVLVHGWPLPLCTRVEGKAQQILKPINIPKSHGA